MRVLTVVFLKLVGFPSSLTYISDPVASYVSFLPQLPLLVLAAVSNRALTAF